MDKTHDEKISGDDAGIEKTAGAIPPNEELEKQQGDKIGGQKETISGTDTPQEQHSS
jgi:hypothetical protein